MRYCTLITGLFLVIDPTFCAIWRRWNRFPIGEPAARELVEHPAICLSEDKAKGKCSTRLWGVRYSITNKTCDVFCRTTSYKDRVNVTDPEMLVYKYYADESKCPVSMSNGGNEVTPRDISHGGQYGTTTGFIDLELEDCTVRSGYCAFKLDIHDVVEKYSYELVGESAMQTSLNGCLDYVANQTTPSSLYEGHGLFVYWKEKKYCVGYLAKPRNKDNANEQLVPAEVYLPNEAVVYLLHPGDHSCTLAAPLDLICNKQSESDDTPVTNTQESDDGLFSAVAFPDHGSISVSERVLGNCYKWCKCPYVLASIRSKEEEDAVIQIMEPGTTYGVAAYHDFIFNTTRWLDETDADMLSFANGNPVSYVTNNSTVSISSAFIAQLTAESELQLTSKATTDRVQGCLCRKKEDADSDDV